MKLFSVAGFEISDQWILAVVKINDSLIYQLVILPITVSWAQGYGSG